MITTMNDKIYRACLFVDEKGGTPSENMANNREAYEYIQTFLLQYIAHFNFELNIRPFQLRYRSFDLYLCDVGGWEKVKKQRFMSSLGNIVNGRLSRVYLFWTGETWEEFCEINPSLRGHDTCINVCCPDWMEQVSEILNKNA